MLKKLLKVAGILMIFSTLLGGLSASAQSQAISGKVIDTGGQPVIGAAVMIPGTTNGATTDLDGNFTLRVAPGTSLEVSCIGYTTQRVSAANGMTITLADDTEMLEETVVIGYGVQKKSDLTGSVASVRETELQNRSTSDAAAALQGRPPVSRSSTTPVLRVRVPQSASAVSPPTPAPASARSSSWTV